MSRNDLFDSHKSIRSIGRLLILSSNIYTTHCDNEYGHYKDVCPPDACQALECVRKVSIRLTLRLGESDIVKIFVCQKCSELFRYDSSCASIEKI